MTSKDSPQCFDFGDGNGLVPAKRYINPDGSMGGWIANTARVYGNAQVYGNARVSGNAWVYERIYE
jgi:YdcK Beta solenoid repeat